MKKNLSTWITAVAAGLLIVFLVNASPLSRLGITIELAAGWRPATTYSYYDDQSCASRHSEGIPFAVKRPNKFLSCTFDRNHLAVVLNGAVGSALGLLGGYVTQKRGFRQVKSPHKD